MRKAIELAAIVALLMAGAASAQSCDRACLEGFVDQYLDAMVAHAPSKAPLTKNVKFTQNGQRLEPGDGLWRTMTAKGTYRLFVDDPDWNTVAFMGTIREAGMPAILALRLKVQNRQISEAETFLVENQNSALNLEKLGHPNPVFQQAIPPAQRASRDKLVKTANLYFQAVEKNDAKGNYPFTDDCNRIENGTQTTNNPNFVTGSLTAQPPARGRGAQAPNRLAMFSPDPAQFNPAPLGCKAQFESGYFHFVTRIRDRRFVAVDRERGLVFAFAFFDHASGKNRTYKMANGTTVSSGPIRPWTWEIAEMWRIENGKIRRVEAMLDQVPYGMESGWSNWEDGMSSRAREP